MTALNKILYVEDSPDIQKIIGMSLEDLGGFQVNICSSGEEALKCVDDYNPDLFLLDVMMPDMDGVKLLEKLRNNPKFADKPAIFITAKANTQDLKDYSTALVIGVIAKPFDPVTISDTIMMLWEYHHSKSDKTEKNPVNDCKPRSYKNKISL